MSDANNNIPPWMQGWTSHEAQANRDAEYNPDSDEFDPLKDRNNARFRRVASYAERQPYKEERVERAKDVMAALIVHTIDSGDGDIGPNEGDLINVTSGKTPWANRIEKAREKRQRNDQRNGSRSSEI